VRRRKIREEIMDLRKKLEKRLSGEKKVAEVEEIEVSTKSWASINKTKLPASCFLWVSGTRNRLPYREGAGEVDVKTGMYKEAGPININAVRSIMSALAGARTGEKMSVPASIKKKAEALAEKYKSHKYKENMFGMKYMIVVEVFNSLGDALRLVVANKFGKDSYVADYSSKEVIIGYNRDSEVGSYASNKYDKIAYKIVKGAVEFVGVATSVKRVTRYESRLSAEDMKKLVEMEASIMNKDEIKIVEK